MPTFVLLSISSPFKVVIVFIKVYHISHQNNRESIKKHGLIPYGYMDANCKWKGLRYDKSIFVSIKFDDIYALDYVNYEGVDIWEFIVLKKHLKKDRHSGHKNHFYIQRAINPFALRLIKHIPYVPVNWNDKMVIEENIPDKAVA